MFACYYALIFIFYSYLVEVIQGQSSECSCYLQSNNDADDDEPHLEFAGGNVHLITTKERWDQKLSEARRDDKIVSLFFVHALDFFSFLFLLYSLMSFDLEL